MNAGKARSFIEPNGSDTLYAQSVALQRLLQAKNANRPYQLFISDLDDTLTVLRRPETYSATNAARALLETQGRVLCVATARSVEWILSEEQRLKSTNLDRLPPHLKIDSETGLKTYGDPRDHEPEGVLDAPIITSSLGAEIYIRRNDSEGGGYVRDEEYATLMRSEPTHWRTITIQLIHALDPDSKLMEFASEETMDGYYHGKAYTAPPNHRIKMLKRTSSTTIGEDDGLASKQEFERRLIFLKRNFANYASLREQGGDITEIEKQFREHGIDISSLEGVTSEDVSNIKVMDESSPAKGVYRFYLVPTHGSKTRAADWIIEKLAKQLKINDGDGDIEVTFAGDSLPDLRLGLLGAGRKKHGMNVGTTFVLAGGSRLTPTVVALSKQLDRDPPIVFAGEDLSAWAYRFEDFDEEKGTVLYKAPLTEVPIKVVIGDLAFPGTKGPETLQAYLSQINNELPRSKLTGYQNYIYQGIHSKLWGIKP